MRYAQAPGLEVERDGEQVLVTIANGTWLVLQGTAAVVWDHLESPRSLDELSDYINNLFSGQPQQVASDLEDFVADLVSRGIVVVGNETT
jgi:hypothetical protein